MTMWYDKLTHILNCCIWGLDRLIWEKLPAKNKAVPADMVLMNGACGARRNDPGNISNQ